MYLGVWLYIFTQDVIAVNLFVRVMKKKKKETKKLTKAVVVHTFCYIYGRKKKCINKWIKYRSCTKRITPRKFSRPMAFIYIYIYICTSINMYLCVICVELASHPTPVNLCTKIIRRSNLRFFFIFSLSISRLFFCLVFHIFPSFLFYYYYQFFFFFFFFMRNTRGKTWCFHRGRVLVSITIILNVEVASRFVLLLLLLLLYIFFIPFFFSTWFFSSPWWCFLFLFFFFIFSLAGNFLSFFLYTFQRGGRHCMKSAIIAAWECNAAASDSLFLSRYISHEFAATYIHLHKLLYVYTYTHSI